MRIFLALFITFSLVGCAGGTIGGLLPAPKILKGAVENNVYTASDQSFKVALPYKDPYEWQYAQVKEERDNDDVTWVIFGPAAFDKNLYHVVLVKHAVTESLEKQTAITYENQVGRRTKLQGSPYTKIADLRFNYKGRISSYGVFENEKQFLILVTLDLGDKFAAFDVDAPKFENLDQDKMRSAISNRTWERFNNFVLSFEPK